MPNYDIIIIGGGISGLSLAHYCLAGGLKTVVVEKTERLGGALYSHTFDDAGGFWLELGAHTLYNSYGNLIKILENRGMVSQMIAREKVPFKLVIDDHMVSIPSRLSFLQLLLSVPRGMSAKKSGQTVRSYYSRLVGAGNYDRVLTHMFSAVASQKADDFAADMLFKKRERRKDVLKKFTFPGGVQAAPDAIAAEEGVECLTGADVSNIELGDGTGVAVTTDKGVLEADYLALATPATIASALLQTAAPELAGKLSQVDVAAIESVAVVVQKNSVSVPRFSSGVGVDDVFYSIVSRDSIPDDAYRGFTFHFKPGVSDKNAKMARICQVLGVGVDKIVAVTAKDNFLPALPVGHADLVGEVDRLLVGTPLLLAGNYFTGMAIEDCVGRSLSEYERLKRVMGV